MAASNPFLDLSGIITVSQTALTSQYTFTVPQGKKALIYEISLNADSNFLGSSVAGQIDLKIKGRSLLANTSRRLSQSFTVDRTAKPIVLDQNETIELLALVASSSGTVQLMISGDTVPADAVI
ncbi:hypothetical protein HYV43_01835 [Candidatus Micrarchaeota archaeon]|nr:hypothetical protein [Candidatus Micrarchaeota archaeon]